MTPIRSTGICAASKRGMVWLALLGASAAQAALLNVDFNSNGSATYVGAGVVGSAGDTWNGIDAGGISSPVANGGVALADAGGNASGAILSFGLDSGGFKPLGCFFGGDLMCDYMFATNKTVTFLISGLQAGDLFDLILLSSANIVDRTTTFSLDGNTKTATASNTGGVFVEGTNYVRYTGSVGAAGVLAFDMIGGSDPRFTQGNINGLQLTLTPNAQAPEPAGIGLLMVGLGALALRRRRPAGA